jgi:hypothetical protein
MMHDCHNHDERWAEFRKRREEWRAHREARREAWRAKRAEHRAQWAKAWGMDPADWGMDAGSGPETAELKAQVEAMKKTIDKLGERIVVLEKLAVSSDDARLAAEIEKLRGTDDHG